jgi:hypothetical protein
MKLQFRNKQNRQKRIVRAIVRIKDSKYPCDEKKRKLRLEELERGFARVSKAVKSKDLVESTSYSKI